MISYMLLPQMPLQVLKQLNLPPELLVSLSDEKGDIEKAKRPWEFLSAGHKIGIPEPLFKELVYALLFCTACCFIDLVDSYLFGGNWANTER